MHRKARSSSIPKFAPKASKQNPTPAQSRPSNVKKTKSRGSSSNCEQNVPSTARTSRVRSGSFSSRSSLAIKWNTPSKFMTPIQNKNLTVSTSKVSRLSVDTLRSSIGGKSGLTVWPQSDSSFKATCIDIILNFLVNNKFPNIIKREMLRNPTRNDFVQIFNFIYGFIDSHYTLPSRFETEIPGLLKALSYPITLTKSVFTIVGSPHSWPSVLAMLAWLVELVVSFNGFDSHALVFDQDFEEKSYLDLRFLSLIRTYKDSIEEVPSDEMMKFKKEIEQYYKISEQEKVALQHKKEKLSLHLEGLRSVEDEIHNFEGLAKQLHEDCQKLHKFNEDLKSHILAKDSERAKLDDQLEQLQLKHQHILETIEELRAMKNAQQYNISELKTLKHRPQEIASQMVQFQCEKKVLEERIWTMEMDISKVRKSLNELSVKYNTEVMRMELESCELITTDLENAIERCEAELLPLLRQKKKEAKEEEMDAHRILMHSKIEEEKLRELIHARAEDCHKLKCKINRLQEEAQFEKTKTLEEEKGLKVLFEQADQKVLKARQQAIKTSFYEHQRNLDESKESLENWKKLVAESRHKAEKSFVENVNLIKKTLAERDRLLAEHRDWHNSLMANTLVESKEILQSVKLAAKGLEDC